MTAPTSRQPTLRLLRGEGQATAEFPRAWFCGYCALRAPVGASILPHARVCPSCGLGLMLEAREDVIPTADDAFLVLDSRLLVQAVSRRAERVLGISEGSWVDQPIGELIVRAEAEAEVASNLGSLILEAVADDGCVRAFVRPRDTFGVRLRARVGACGPPRAALLVLERSGRPLRAL